MIYVILLYVVFLAWAWCTWALWCNAKTHADRVTLIEYIRDSAEDWRADADAFEAVTYSKHFRARLFFRDWRRLYRFSEEPK